MKDRIDLEEAITEVFAYDEELETIIYKLGNSPAPPREDEMRNMLIGIKELNKARFEKLWNTFEAMLANGAIPNSKPPSSDQ